MLSDPSQMASEPFVLPASFAQQRMWFLDRLDAGSPAYNVCVATRLRGPLNAQALKLALEAVVDRHESLRTGFTLVDGVPHQVIAAAVPTEIEFIDLTGDPDAEQSMRERVSGDGRRHFDLSEPGLFHVTLMKLGVAHHVLSLTFHHIITDAWSVGVLTREIAEFYGGHVDDREVELPELAIQYADYAAWQQEWMDSGGLDQQLEYWTDRLAGAPAMLDLPTDRPRPRKQSLTGATFRTVLPVALRDGVRTLSERHGSTPFMTLLAAFATMLARYSGQDDIVIATPVANRNRLELEQLTGLLVNTLALRVELQDDPPFTELLRAVRETALDAFSHQDLPFERLVQELNPERNQSHAPVAQVMFALQSSVEAGVTFSGLEHERVVAERGTAKFDLAMYVSEVGDGLRVAVEYCSDLFEEGTIVRMLAHFTNLLEAAIADPMQRASQLRIMDAAEREAALAAWKGDGREFAVACMHELFERHAADRPGAVAATFGGATISYGELNERANQLAHRLHKLGARNETMVALLLEPSFDMLVAILGVLKAGAAYVPLDPEYPKDRLAFVLEDTKAPIVVTVERLRTDVPSDAAAIVALDAERDDLAGESSANPEPLASPGSLAYVIYTSGSTGTPKGVLVEHRQVARLFAATEPWYGFGSSDTWMLLHSYAFDFSVWELWGALAHGGRLVISPRSTTRAPHELAQLVCDEGVTVLNATPSLFLALQDELLRLTERVNLRLVIFGGEALHPASLRPWFERYRDGGPTLVNMYGITETTVHVTYRPLSQRDCDEATSPIGVPIPDLSLYLLDGNREPVPRGVIGELYVGGAGVARGYLNRPELTAERFVENPFGAGRLYRTGDVARSGVAGELVFHGRMDDQVKIRGFRIELGEIRAALIAHSAVSEAAVVPVRADAGDARLVAYVVPDGSPDAPAADALRAFVAARLPAYMVPSAWVFVETLPLTRNGKLDTRALPKPEFTRSAAADVFVAPSTETERALAQIWGDVLGVEQVGVNDDFFELGGHSMLAVRLFAVVEQKLGARLPLSALFETPTVAGLAALLERDRRGEIDWSTLVPLRAGDDSAPLFLVAWAGGEVLPYRDVVENLAPGRPVYGLLAPGVDRRTPPLATVADLATYYLTQVREAQPRGPYLLGGHCFSGLVAYEMARKLRLQGESVSLLALFDAYPSRRGPRPSTTAAQRPGRIEIERTKFRAFREASLPGKALWVKSRLAGLRNRGRDTAYLKIGPWVYERLAARGQQHRIPHRPWNLVLVASNLARRTYAPPPADLRVDFFRAQTTLEPRPTPWDSVAARGVTVHPVVAQDINHASMMHDPHAQVLAAELSRVLDGLGQSSAERTGSG